MSHRNVPLVRSSSTDRGFTSKRGYYPFDVKKPENESGDKEDYREVWSISDRDFYEDENEEEDTRLILDILKLEKRDSQGN